MLRDTRPEHSIASRQYKLHTWRSRAEGEDSLAGRFEVDGVQSDLYVRESIRCQSSAAAFRQQKRAR